MKKLAIIPCFLFAFAIAAQAQNSKNNDPSYSIHNYKHPNKAKIAKEANLDQAVNLEYKGEISDNTQRNYKAQNTSKSATSGVIVPSGDKNTKRNYKQQF